MGLYPTKKIATMKQERDKKKDADKWLKREWTTDQMLKAWDREMIDIKLDKDTSFDDLLEILSIYHDGIIDKNEKQTLKMLMKGERVAYPRQLGDWITLLIDGSKGTIRCNCERCNFDGKCDWAATFDVLQFRTKPTPKCLLPDEAYNWSHQVLRAINGMKNANLEV